MRYKKLKTCLSVIVFLLPVGLLMASPTEKYSLFLAGVLLIDENRNLSSEQKAFEYKYLQKLTGVSSDKALQYIQNLQNNPSQLKLIYSEIITSLTGKDVEETKKSGESKKNENKNMVVNKKSIEINDSIFKSSEEKKWQKTLLK